MEISTVHKNIPTKNKNGGVRAGAGRPRGSRNKKPTLTSLKKEVHALEKAKEISYLDQQLLRKVPELARAMTIPALGMNFVYRIDEEKNAKGTVISRKHVLVENPHEIAEALDQMEAGATHPEDKYYYVSAVAPDWRAGEALLSRVFGRPKESIALDTGGKASLLDLLMRAAELPDTPALMSEAHVLHAEVKDIVPYVAAAEDAPETAAPPQNEPTDVSPTHIETP